MLKCCCDSDRRMEGQTLADRHWGSDDVLPVVGCQASFYNASTAPVVNIQPLQYCHRGSNLAIAYISATPLNVHEVSSSYSFGDCLLTSATVRAVVDRSRLRTLQLAADASRRMRYYAVICYLFFSSVMQWLLVLYHRWYHTTCVGMKRISPSYVCDMCQ